MNGDIWEVSVLMLQPPRPVLEGPSLGGLIKGIAGLMGLTWVDARTTSTGIHEP